MRIITKQYFLNKIKSDKLKKKYIPGISNKIIKSGKNWEAVCYFELENNKVFFLDYNLDSIFIPTSYDIEEEEIKSEILNIDDWKLTRILDKLSHNKNNLHKSLDWDGQYSMEDDKPLFRKLLNIESGTWKLENNRINETIIFSLSIEVFFNSEIYLYIGIDEFSTYPYKVEEVKNKVHFIKQLIEWMI